MLCFIITNIIEHITLQSNETSSSEITFSEPTTKLITSTPIKNTSKYKILLVMIRFHCCSLLLNNNNLSHCRGGFKSPTNT